METLRQYIKRIALPDISVEAAARKKLDSLTKPPGSLGKLEDLAVKYSVIRGDVGPLVKRKVIFTLAADHGVAVRGVSAYPQEVTVQMVRNMVSGGAAVNVLASHVGAKVVIADMGVKGRAGEKEGLKVFEEGCETGDITVGPAMTRESAAAAVRYGINLVEEEARYGLDIIGVGEMGIGNTTPSAAIVAVVTGSDPSDVTGRGTGITDDRLRYKTDVIKKAIEINSPDPKDGLDVLSRVGGYEIAGLTGVILAAAANSIPVVLDGFISAASALIAGTMAPLSVKYMIASHLSCEYGHLKALRWLELEPVLDLKMRLGEGTGAALAIGIVEASVKIMNKMATFRDAGVSDVK